MKRVVLRRGWELVQALALSALACGIAYGFIALVGLSTRYAYDQDATWRKAHEQAQAEVEKANATIAERCKQLGVPKQFAPSIEYHWVSRGENAVRDRRTDLRTAAKRRVEAIEKSAFVEIEKASVEAQTQLLTHGLTSAAASRFLEQMPPIEALMPSLDMSKIDAIVDGRKGRDRWDA